MRLLLGPRRFLFQPSLHFLQSREGVLLVLFRTARAADADHADDLVIDLDEDGSGAGEIAGVRRDLVGESSCPT